MAFLPSFFFSVYGNCVAQELVSPAGGEFTGEKISLSWSMGEVMTETLNGENFTFNQGFQQPSFTITGIENANIGIDKIEAYPNPFTRYFYLNIKSIVGTGHKMLMYDSSGKLIQEGQLNEGLNKIDANGLPGDMYVVEIVNKRNKVKQSFKLIKNN